MGDDDAEEEKIGTGVPVVAVIAAVGRPGSCTRFFERIHIPMRMKMVTPKSETLCQTCSDNKGLSRLAGTRDGQEHGIAMIDQYYHAKVREGKSSTLMTTVHSFTNTADLTTIIDVAEGDAAAARVRNVA